MFAVPRRPGVHDSFPQTIDYTKYIYIYISVHEWSTRKFTSGAYRCFILLVLSENGEVDNKRLYLEIMFI